METYDEDVRASAENERETTPAHLNRGSQEMMMSQK